MLTDAELQRYKTQIRILSETGQNRLKDTKVFVAGAGGLGSAVSTYLVAAGIGKIKLVDEDRVELSNLNRQILHWEKDRGRRKVVSAEEKLRGLNPCCEVRGLSENINESNVDDLADDCAVIVDAADNYPTRFLLNEVAVAKNIPLFHGAVHGFYGQTTTIIPGRTACLRCIFPEDPPPADFPVVGVSCGIIGCIQAAEVIKYVTGKGDLLANRLLMWDGLKAAMEIVAVEQNPGCEVCQKGQT